MMIYLERDALLRLYLEDEGRDSIKQAVRQVDAVATTAIGYPWARAWLAEACRDGWLNSREYTSVVDRLNLDWGHLVRVPATEAVLKMAGDLADRWALDGRGGIELASALVLCQYGEGIPVFFGAMNRRLGHAAEGEGLAMMTALLDEGVT
jgi:hypothetical protein